MSTADMMVISLKININYFEKAIYSQIVESFFFFIMKGCWLFSIAFSASIAESMHSFLLYNIFLINFL